VEGGRVWKCEAEWRETAVGGKLGVCRVWERVERVERVERSGSALSYGCSENKNVDDSLVITEVNSKYERENERESEREREREGGLQ
jgi:hypothetical protein